MFKPTNFYEILTPMYFVTKIFGLSPFRITNKGFERSKLNILWSVFLMFFVTISACTGLNTQMNVKVGFITKVTRILDGYLTIVGLCCGILFGCIFVNTILTASHDINTFDLRMHINFQTNLKKEYRKSSIYISAALLTVVSYVSLLSSFTAVVTKDLFTPAFIGEFIAYVGPAIINSFVNFQFCTLIFCMKQRFSWVNRKIADISSKLEESLQECDDIFSVSTKGIKVRPATHVVTTGLIQDEALNVIKKVRVKHYELCSISKRINKAYSFQILLIVVQSFVSVIAGLLYAGQHVFTNRDLSVDYLLYSALQINLVIMQVVILVAVCSSASEEAQKTGILIHSAISLKLEDKCKEDLQSEITSFSLQLLHHNVKFTACRIFVINENLLFSIVGAITTYLVIVIQFELVDSKK